MILLRPDPDRRLVERASTHGIRAGTETQFQASVLLRHGRRFTATTAWSKRHDTWLRAQTWGLEGGPRILVRPYPELTCVDDQQDEFDAAGSALNGPLRRQRN